MNKLFFNIRNDYNNYDNNNYDNNYYDNNKFIEPFEVQNEENEKIFFLNKKYAIFKLNQLTFGCTTNQQLNTKYGCGIDNNFWKENINKFIIIINKDPKNGYSSFATYLDNPVWLGTNNTLEYKFKTFINFDDANNYRNNYLNSTNNLYDIPSYLSYIIINKNDINIIPLNLDNIILCGIEENYWEKNKNKFAVISYFPTYNDNGITNKPFAKYKNNDIWNYTTSELIDINDMIYNFIIPLNLSIGYKWIYNNLNSKLNLIVPSTFLIIKSICTTFPSSCSISSDIFTYLNNKSIFIVVQITNNVFNFSFAYLYNKEVSYIYSGYNETIDDIIFNYNLINYKEYNNLLPNNLNNIISKSIFYTKFQNYNTIKDENPTSIKDENIKSINDENPKSINDENPKSIKDDIMYSAVIDDDINKLNKITEKSIKDDIMHSTIINDVMKKLNKITEKNIKDKQNATKSLEEDVVNLSDDDIYQQTINTTKESNLKVKYHNYLEKRIELIEKKREELRFIEMSNMSCCIVVSLIMLFVILIFTLCKKKNSKKEEE